MGRRTEDAPGPPEGGGGERTTWAFIAMLALLSAALWIGPARWANVPGIGFHLGLLPFAAIVGLAVFTKVTFEFRREAFITSFHELAFVLGLALCAPATLFAGCLIGTCAAELANRAAFVKACFNIALLSLELGLVRALLGRFEPGVSLARPAGAVALLVAMAIANVVCDICVFAVVRLSGSPVKIRPMLAVKALSLTQALCITAEGVVTVIVLEAQPWAVVLLGLLVLIFGLGYRAYTALRARYANLGRLYSFGSALSDDLAQGEVMRQVLERPQRMLNAERVVLTAPVGGGFIRTWIDDDHELRSERVERPDPLSAVVIRTGRGLVVPRQGRNTHRGTANDLGLRDAVAAPVTMDDGQMGALLIAQRASEVKTFDAEDLRLLEAVAAHASVAMRNGQLLDRLQTEASTRAHQALHDSLTGLGNRTLFSERMQAALESSDDAVVAVMLMDLDEFKEINDTLGHHTGDSVLQEVAGRLSRTVGLRGTVARLGGDEFAVCLPACPSTEAALAFADGLRRVIDEPITVEDLTLEVRASIGVAISPEHGSDPSTVLRRADVAMYDAKKTGRGVEVYSAERDHSSPRRLALIGDLGHAIESNQLTLAFQPKADLASGHVIGMEALLRWSHPTYGFVPPDEFIPMAEQLRLIQPLTQWVLGNALSQIAIWRSQGMDLTIAVNVSARSLLNGSLIDDVKGALAQTKVPAGVLTLELTETSVMADPVRSEEVLGQLSELGCRISVDDFGTGFSSLSRLKHLPVNEVKIDKSFVFHMTNDADDAVIVRSIIDLARNLGLQVVAEGVEDLDTLNALRALGCDAIQGYFLCRPIPADALTTWLESKPMPRLAVLRAKTTGQSAALVAPGAT